MGGAGPPAAHLSELHYRLGQCFLQTGEISTAEAKLRIMDTRKPLETLTVHVCEVVTGAIRQGASASITVDAERRQKIVRNHTATHLLQAALQKILGSHIKQAGSLVEPERLRFDFTHFSPVTNEELMKIEEEVNAQIRFNAAVESAVMTADAAQAAGAMALFGEKYGDEVRVISVGGYSKELCGGTHANAAGDIGLFRIISEGGIAAGVRRIEAATGDGALAVVHQQAKTLQRLADLVKSEPQQLETRLTKMVERQREMERELATLESRLKTGQADDILNSVQEIDGVRLLAAEVDPADGKGLREMADKLRDKLGSGVVAIGCPFQGKVNLLVAVTRDLTDKLHAGKLVGAMAAEVGGKGGGRPVLAVLNLTPVARPRYRIGVPHGGPWEILLNSDDGNYWGSGAGSTGAVDAVDVPMHGRSQSLSLNLPPLGVIFAAPAT